jgi:hypothetical protein
MFSSFEKFFMSFYKLTPNLSKDNRKNLASYFYFVAIAWLIFQIVGLIRLFAAVGIVSFVQISDSTYSLTTGLVFFIAISLVVQVLQIILPSMALLPLKSLQRSGWELMFASFLLGLVTLVVNWSLAADLMGLLKTLTIVVVSGYLLYEVRSFFVKKSR